MLKNLLLNLLRSSFQSVRVRPENDLTVVLEPVTKAFQKEAFQHAVELLQGILLEYPNNAQATYLLGRAHMNMGNLVEARAHFEKITSGKESFAAAHSELARILYAAGETEASEKACRQAINAEPMVLEYRLLLVEVLEVAGNKSGALRELAKAQEIAPERVDLLLKVCEGLDRMGRYQEMLPLAERARLEMGESTEVLSCVAVARHGVDDMPGAVAACKQAIALAKKETPLSQVYVTLGSSLFGLGDLGGSLAAYKRALKLMPNSVTAKYNIGLINLMQRRFRQGWEGFEFRLGVKRNQSLRSCEPRWKGGALGGQSILIMREQGLGDEIMYSSCYPEVSGRSKKCFIECDPRLERLFARSFPNVTFLPLRDLHTKEQSDPGESVDWRIYAGSLPHYFRNSVDDFPKHSGYLRSDSERVQYWHSRLNRLGKGLKIGVSWRGGTSLTLGGRRSLTLEQLKPILEIPGIHWINLQYGDRKREIESLRNLSGIEVHDWTEAIDGSYDETAALVDSLDMVISVATAVVHLTGALGKKVWILAASVPEWRYGASGADMPWYPSARIFRQTDVNQWVPVLNQIKSELCDEVSRSAGG